MQWENEVQHVFLVGAKSLGAYGGYETFVYKLTEYHQNKKNIKYHVACKANGDGCMDETKVDGVTRINDHEFEFHNAHCFKIDIPQIGPAQAIYYDVAALKTCCKYIKEHRIKLVVKPLVDAFFAYLKQNEPKIPKNGKIREAFTYALNQESYLKVFLEDGDVPIDNNASERAIRGFCIGKKNWEMIDTVNGANSSAIIYSIAETAKANNLKPFDYFEYLLTEIPKHVDDKNTDFLAELLPWSDMLPENIRKPQKANGK